MENVGLALEKVNLGTIYECRLSRRKMLVLELEKPTGQEPTGKKDENGNVIMKPKYTMVKAGKYVDIVNETPVFKVDEIADGQLMEI